MKLDSYLINNPPNFSYKIEYFYFLVSHILTLQTIFKDKEFVTLNRKNLRSSIVSNIDSYIRILENGEFIISDNLNIKGKKSKGYKLNIKYLYWMGTFEIPINSKLFNKIVKKQRNKRAHINRLEPHLKQMYKKFMRTKIDYPKAQKWILNNIPTNKQIFHIAALNSIKDERFRFFRRNKTNNRLDTNFTTLKKELKQFIIGDFVSIDLKNSQPFFLSVLLNTIINKPINNNMVLYWYNNSVLNIAKTFGIKPVKKIFKIHQNNKNSNLVNLKTFSESVLNGTIYNEFIHLYSKEITRDEVKDIIFKVLFSKNIIQKEYKSYIPYKKEKEIFASVFPFIMDSIKVLKENKHSKLAIFLQKIESYMFLDCIAKNLVDAGIVPLTIHDSFLIERKHKEKALKIIESEFLRLFGVIPSFHIENIIYESYNTKTNANNKKTKICHLKREYLENHANSLKFSQSV